MTRLEYLRSLPRRAQLEVVAGGVLGAVASVLVLGLALIGGTK